MQARACECVMGGSLDTMCQNTIAFVSKTDRMVIWTNFRPNLNKLTKNMIDQCLEFSFVNSIFSKESQVEIRWKLTQVHVAYFDPLMTRFQD